MAVVVKVPATREKVVDQGQSGAMTRAKAVTRSAARQASLLAGSLALPPGFLGWLTVLPEMAGVWRLQSQMVADIAGVYGKSATLTREQMVYCLFKHVSAQLFRDVIVRAGERFLVQRASNAVLQSIVQKLGIKLTEKLVGKGASRFMPVLGALGVGAYAYFDTTQVARNAIELFSSDIVINEAFDV